MDCSPVEEECDRLSRRDKGCVVQSQTKNLQIAGPCTPTMLHKGPLNEDCPRLIVRR